MLKRVRFSRIAVVSILGLTLLGSTAVPIAAQETTTVAASPVASPVVHLDPAMVAGISIPMQNNQRTGVVEGTGISGSPQIDWQTPIDEEAGWLPAVGDGIIADISATRLSAYDRATGDLLWQVPFSADSGNPVLIDGVIYLTGVDGAFAFDAATGAQLWQFDAGLPPGTEDWMPPSTLLTGDPLKIGDTVFVSGGLWGGVYALDAATGEELWRFDTNGTVPGSLSEADGAIVFSSDGIRTFVDDGTESTLHALDPATGDELWSIPLGEGVMSFATALIVDGKALLNIYDQTQNRGSVRAYDLATHELLWTTVIAPVNGTGPMSASDGKFYISGADATGVFAYDLNTGDLVWEHETSGVTNGFAPVVGNELLVLTNDATLESVDTVTGGTFWNLPVGDRVPYGVSGAQVVDGTIYVDAGTQLLAISGDGGPAPAVTGGSDYPEAAPVAADADDFFSVQSQLTPGEPFFGPQGIAVAPDGKVYVIDAINDRIQVFNADGSFLKFWGETGSGDGQFNFHEENARYGGDITFTSDGTPYVSDSNNGRVQKFDADGNFIAAWPIASADGDGSSFLEGIAVDESTGRIYVGDWNSNLILMADADGQYVGEWGADGATNSMLFANPTDVAVAKDGTVLVTDSQRQRLRFFTPDGELVQTWGGAGTDVGRYDGLTSVALDASGNIYVLDYNNARIQVYSPDGEVIGVFSGRLADSEVFSNAWSVAVGPDGLVYVVDEGVEDGLVAVLRTPLTTAPAATPIASPAA